MRAPLAPDADHQRLLIVHAVGGEACGTLREQPVRRALEEEERGMRLELGIAGEQHLVSLFERAQVLALLLRQLLEYAAAPRVAGNRRGTRIELQTAALRGNGDTQRVAGEEQFGGAAVDRGRLPSRTAVLALAVDLDHALSGGEVARGSDLLDERLDVRAEELRGLIAGFADQVKVPRVA